MLEGSWLRQGPVTAATEALGVSGSSVSNRGRGPGSTAAAFAEPSFPRGEVRSGCPRLVKNSAAASETLVGRAALIAWLAWVFDGASIRWQLNEIDPHAAKSLPEADVEL